jgi:glutaminase
MNHSGTLQSQLYCATGKEQYHGDVEAKCTLYIQQCTIPTCTTDLLVIYKYAQQQSARTFTQTD